MNRAKLRLEHRVVNGSFGDPVIYVFQPGFGSAFLFDLGTLDALTNKDVLRVTHAFVSHCHIDHFCGFDRLLRVNVPHFRRIRITGPTGIIDRVRGKLHGYTWNLLEPDQVVFEVTSVEKDGSTLTAVLSNTNHFQPVNLRETAPTPNHVAVAAEFESGATMTATVVDHGTECVAYAFQEPMTRRFRHELLPSIGLKPGGWIQALERGRSEEAINIGGKDFETAKLTKTLFEEEHHKPLGYMTDIAFSRSNAVRLEALLADVDHLISECHFDSAQEDRALQKSHLTSTQVAILSALVRAKQLEIFHISNVNSDREEEIRGEVATLWDSSKRLTSEQLWQRLPN